MDKGVSERIKDKCENDFTLDNALRNASQAFFAILLIVTVLLFASLSLKTFCYLVRKFKSSLMTLRQWTFMPKGTFNTTLRLLL